MNHEFLQLWNCVSALAVPVVIQVFLKKELGCDLMLAAWPWRSPAEFTTTAGEVAIEMSRDVISVIVLVAILSW